MSPAATTLRCSMCRQPIASAARHYRCSVSSCNTGKLKLLFCSPGCFDAHIPTARHKNAAAIEIDP